MNTAKLETLKDPEALAHRVAGWMLDLAVAKRGNVAVALSGGSTPKRLYQMLAEAPYRDVFPWDRTHWFFGDERCVPHDDEQSNFHMVREAMFAKAPIPPDNIHAIPTENVTPQAGAVAYEDDLKHFYGSGQLEASRQLFDIMLLGLGEDGHTASLFPGTSVLGEREKWAAAVAKTPNEMRITLTYPVLESSRHTAFLIAGNDKRKIFSRFQKGEKDLPAVRFSPIGDLTCFVDEAAAGTPS